MLSQEPCHALHVVVFDMLLVALSDGLCCLSE